MATMAAIDPISTKRRFAEFFDQRSAQSYGFKVAAMMEQKKTRLLVDLSALRAFDNDREQAERLADSLLSRPHDYLPIMEDALRDHVANLDAKYMTKHGECRVGIVGPFGWRRCTPRQLLSNRLSQLVRVDGIVTKCSLVRPKIVQSVHYSAHTKQFVSKSYTDITTLTSSVPSGASMPKVDEQGNQLSTEYGLCTYRDHQTIVLQETPESAPPGQLPRSVEIILEDDLVDVCKPGDRISVSGIYRAAPRRAVGPDTGIMRAVVVANAVQASDSDHRAPQFTQMDLRNIKSLARMSSMGPMDILAHSLAPSIFGHDLVKKALVMQLVGGTEKVLENGTHLRGDINVLMVGDPGVAKSQLLRAVMNVAPLAVSTTGRGSSGVGLTAAVTTDQETGDRRLEAGAMVLADRGVVCIDEFDKMNDNDRVAIHEVMEQQTVTVAKAGIHATLNARCSVTAAANPLYGCYEPSMSITKNINLPDSLLSRFDVLFVLLDTKDPAHDHEVTFMLLDTKDPAHDHEVANHVLKMHAYLPETVALPEDREEEEEEGQSGEAMWMAMDRRRSMGHGKVLTVAFLRKYIHYVKAKFNPSLSDAACERISEIWAEMRQTGMKGNRVEGALPITARTLETLIRLSTAAAKIRQSNTVDLPDVLQAQLVLAHATAGPHSADEAAPEAGASDSPPPAPGTPDRDDDAAPAGRDAPAAEASHRPRRSTRAPRVEPPETPPRAEEAVEGADVADVAGTSAGTEADASGSGASAEAGPSGPGEGEVDEEFGVPPGEGAEWTDVFLWENRRGRDMTSRERSMLDAVLASKAREYEEDAEGRGIDIEAVVQETIRRCGSPPALQASAVRRALLAEHNSGRWMIAGDTLYPSFG